MADKTYLYIKKNWCKRCGICIEFCPKGVFKKDKEGYPVIDDIKKCTECQICAAICPDLAIIVEEKTAELMKDR